MEQVTDPVTEQEKAMSLPPSIATALAEAHRRDLLSQAEACRLARTARRNRTQPARRAPRLMMTIRSRPAILVAITLALGCLIAVGTAITSRATGRSAHATTVAASSSWSVDASGSNGGASRTY
jgi:hypothetical protein